jgi:endo-1,3-1,4-beta-glycanase ExoK
MQIAKRLPVPLLAGGLAIGSVTLIGIGSSASDAQHSPVVPPSRAQRVSSSAFADRFARRNDRLWSVSNGWRNGSYMVNDWRASQVRFGPGLTLTLALNRTDKAAFSSGEVQSRAFYKYGYFETRMRAAPGSGTVTGFFTYTGPPFGRPWDEIDVEILGAKPREVEFTYFRNGKKLSKIQPLGFDATAATHVYGFEWQPELLQWYVDGKLVYGASGSALPLPQEPQKIMVSLWASDTLGSWVGPFNRGAVPTRALVSCISYSHSFATRQNC